MANMEKLQTYPVVCEGGLNSNENYILLAARTPGQATNLLNFEPSLFGGYRKIDGFTAYDTVENEVDPANATGKILGVCIFSGSVLAIRALTSGSVYQIYKSNSGWTAYTTGLTLTSTGVDKVRTQTYNFDGSEDIIFVDGVNGAIIHDGSTWSEMTSSDTGADQANAGGNQILDAPSLITKFKNHIFISGDSTTPNVIAHSAPNAAYDWTSASGAGQLNAGFAVKQIKPFRDELYIFGENDIKKIVVENTTFVLKDVAQNIGCISTDTVIEFNGDLLFLAQDGIRTVAATERNNDVELGVLSKDIQQDIKDLISDADLVQVDATIIRGKSQVRFFFGNSGDTVANSEGIIGAIRNSNQSTTLEWGRLKGIRTSCVTSDYIGTEEFVIHGDYNGKVYRQEVGDSFDGENILAVYSTPFYDFGDVFIRKNIRKILVFVRPEQAVTISSAIKFDWEDPFVLNPSQYLLESFTETSLYGTGLYGTATYANSPGPVLIKNVEGSGFSAQLVFTSNDMAGSFSIQAIVFEYSVNGRK